MYIRFERKVKNLLSNVENKRVLQQRIQNGGRRRPVGIRLFESQTPNPFPRYIELLTNWRTFGSESPGKNAAGLGMGVVKIRRWRHHDPAGGLGEKNQKVSTDDAKIKR